MPIAIFKNPDTVQGAMPRAEWQFLNARRAGSYGRRAAMRVAESLKTSLSSLTGVGLPASSGQGRYLRGHQQRHERRHRRGGAGGHQRFDRLHRLGEAGAGEAAGAEQNRPAGQRGHWDSDCVQLQGLRVEASGGGTGPTKADDLTGTVLLVLCSLGGLSGTLPRAKWQFLCTRHEGLHKRQSVSAIVPGPARRRRSSRRPIASSPRLGSPAVNGSLLPITLPNVIMLIRYFDKVVYNIDRAL